MALDISTAIALQMAGKTVRWSILFHFDFLSGPRRVWSGDYPITIGGHTWDGVRSAVTAVDPGTPSKDGAAEPFSVTVSGVDPSFVSRVLAAESDSIGRRLAIYLCFFTEEWQPIDELVPLRRGRMTGFAFAGAGDQPRTVTVRAEGSLVARGRAPLTFISDAEQKRRFPGDRGAEFLPSMQSATVVWPQ